MPKTETPITDRFKTPGRQIELDLLASHQRLERDRSELIGALEILDDIGNVVLPLHQYRNAPDQTTVMGWDKVSLRLGHLRKARALLAKLKETT